MKIAFVTNFCPHYRVRTFERLAERMNVEFLFFSSGQEWYWPSRQGTRTGNFPHEYLPGFRLGKTRIVPALARRLWSGDFDVIVKCINGKFALPVALLVAQLRGKPFVLWTGIWHRLQTPQHRFLQPLTRYVYRASDAIVVYGEHVRRFLIETEGVEADKVFVAHHATDGEPYRRAISEAESAALADRLGLPEGSKVVLYAGRLEEAKGVDGLLEAFLTLGREDACLLFVGDGARSHELHTAVSRAGASRRIRFARGVSPEAMPAYYALADLLVLPSRTTPAFKEPWGLVVNEAFYQSLPAITTDAVGAAAGGLVEDGHTGLVVPEGDPAALAHALRRLLDDEELRSRLGENARLRVEAWTNERMVDGFVKAVEHAVCRRRPR